MGEEKNNEYYDNIFKKFKHYSLDVDGYNSPWNHLYKMVKGFLNKDDKILELGCGTGQFAEVLINEGYDYVLGMDFSDEAISMSKERCGKNTFVCENIYDFDFSKIDFDTAIALEIFEHIEQDLEVIRRFPKGKKLIFSVPQYDAGGHVRFYPNEKSVTDRFESIFTQIKINNTGSIYVIKGIK